MTDQDVQAERRHNLLAERERLAGQVAGLEPGSGNGDAFDDNFADSGQVAAEQGENMALAAQLRAELDDVERALEKLDSDTYGLCETCHEPIAPARLEAMPTARFCIDHA